MAVKPHTNQLGKKLLAEGLLDEHQLASALGKVEQWGFRLGRAMTDLRVATHRGVAEAIGRIAGVPYIDLAATLVDIDAIEFLDAEISERLGIFAYGQGEDQRSVLLAMADPTDLDTIDLVTQRTGKRVIGSVAPESVIMRAIGMYYRDEEVSLDLDDEVRTTAEDEFKLVDMAGKTLMVDGAGANLQEELARTQLKMAQEQAARDAVEAEIAAAAAAPPAPPQPPRPQPAAVAPVMAPTAAPRRTHPPSPQPPATGMPDLPPMPPSDHVLDPPEATSPLHGAPAKAAQPPSPADDGSGHVDGFAAMPGQAPPDVDLTPGPVLDVASPPVASETRPPARAAPGKGSGLSVEDKLNHLKASGERTEKMLRQLIDALGTAGVIDASQFRKKRR